MIFVNSPDHCVCCSLYKQSRHDIFKASQKYQKQQNCGLGLLEIQPLFQVDIQQTDMDKKTKGRGYAEVFLQIAANKSSEPTRECVVALRSEFLGCAARLKRYATGEENRLKQVNIIIIFGASGSGKTTLMNQLINSGGQYSIHIKHTDRPPRQYDDVEIKCVKAFNPQDFDYVYQTYGFRYGIQRKQIDKAIAENRHHFIICNDILTIKALKRDYGSLVKAVFTFFDAPNDVLRQIQLERQISDDEIDLRLAKTYVLYRQFVEEWHLFDEILENHYKEDASSLRKRMENMLAEFAESVDPESVFEHMKSVAGNLATKLDDNETESMPGYVFKYNTHY